MKKQIILGCALGVVAVTASAQSSVTIYGTLDLAVRRVTNTNVGSDITEVSSGSNSSRFGVRATEDLGGGRSARFVIESDMFPDTGLAGNANNATPVPAGQFWSRQSWVGLTDARLGEIRLGRDYTPAFNVWANYDPFSYVGAGGLANMLSSSQNVAISSAFGASSSVSANTTVRANNSVAYTTPSFGGLFAQVMVAAGEGAASTGSTGNSKFQSGRVAYVAGPIDVQVAVANTDNTLVSGQAFKQSVLGGSYDFGVAKVFFDTTQVKFGSAKSQVIMLAASAPLGAGILKASWARTNQSGTTAAGVSIDDRDASQLALGYVYSLSKRTAVYGTASRIVNKGSAAGFNVPGGPAFIAGTDRKSTGIEFGVRHFF